MADSSIRFGQPHKIENLKTARLWSLEFAETLDAEFRFYLCEKTADGYQIHGLALNTRDAFRLRKQLAEELNAKIFVRARRVETAQTFDDDSDALLERFKDWFNEGVSTGDVPAHLRSDYQAFLGRRGRSAR